MGGHTHFCFLCVWTPASDTSGIKERVFFLEALALLPPRPPPPPALPLLLWWSLLAFFLDACLLELFFSECFRFEDFELRLRIGNLLDKDYQVVDGFNTQDRTAQLSLNYQF